MSIRTTQEGPAHASAKKKCQEDIAQKLDKWKASGYLASTKLELKEAYRACSDWDAGCPVCLEGERRFMKGLTDIASGNITEGFSGISSSFITVKFKWSLFMDKFRRS